MSMNISAAKIVIPFRMAKPFSRNHRGFDADIRILDDNIWDYSKTLEPLYVNYNKYTPEQWCNHGSKSFTSLC